MKLSEAMQKATAELADKFGITPYHINAGWCDQWAALVCDEVYGACDFADDLESDPLAVGHYFIGYNGLYYDAECPGGVVDFHDLPIFIRANGEDWRWQHATTEPRAR